MCFLTIHKQAVSSYIFVLLLIFHNYDAHLFKRSSELEKAQSFNGGKDRIISEEDRTKDPGAGPSKPDTMPHSVSRRQSFASFSRLYLCKWLSPREELLSLPMCTRIGDFPYLNECRVFRHCINVGSTTIKACCPVGSHFDHIFRECVHAKEARCLTRDLEDQWMDSAFYEESAVDLPHADAEVVHVDDYVDDLHDDIVEIPVVDDVDDDSEPLDDSFEVIDPSVLANSDKAWKYYPAPPHLYPGAFWNHNPYTGRMEPGKFGYAMPISMSYSVEPVQKIRPPRRRRPKWKKPGPFEGSHGGNERRRSTEEYDPKAGLEEDDDEETGNREDSKEKNKMNWSGQTFDENDKSSSRSSSPAPEVTPMTTAVPFPITTTPSSEQSLIVPVIPVQPPAPPPPFATLKPMTKPLPPVELIKFTTKRPGAPKDSDEDNGFELESNSEKKTTLKPPTENQKANAPLPRKSNEPPPPIMGIPGKSGFDASSEEENGKKKKRSGEFTDHDAPQSVTQSVTQSPVTPRQVGNDEGGIGGQSEKELSVLPDFENSSEQDGISNGGIQGTSNNLAVRSNQANQQTNLKINQPIGGGVEQIASLPSLKRKRQVPMSMMRRRVIPRRKPDYFYYNY